MSNSPSLQPVYSFDGWVIKNIKLSSDAAVIKIGHDKRHFSQCPYLTVVLNGETGEVLHLAEGKKKESLEAFFNKLTPQRISDIEAVGMDRSGAYKSVVTKVVPHAAIVYDKFHIVANYNKAIDEVRRSDLENPLF
jgi:transposase